MHSEDEITLRRRGEGFALEGPGYYLWDEDPREVLRAAAELRRGIVPHRPIGRMLVLRGPAEEPGPA